MIELRTSKSEVTFRAAAPGSGSPGTIVGRPACFGVRSHVLGDARSAGRAFREKMNGPGVFARTLKSDADVVCNMDHDTSKILGRRRNKTLDLFTDDKGLLMRCVLPNTTTGRDAAALIARGDCSEMSFAFTPDEDSWDEEDACSCDNEDCTGCSNGVRMKMPVRTLKSVSLKDVAVLTGSPAYPKTAVSMVNDREGMDFVFYNSLPPSMPMEMRSRIERNMSSAEKRKAMASLIMNL